ncbi:DUF695 domain-containing protein [Nonomuraea ferruginea]|uniref:DUF695 domain-containing protein n=1 Tax=Nonomuraea ferruginea TaxID=46174 RepID=A0ABT4SXL0_9ACTN|nr:DUF695 domain-containing protein [Nonomuraea ferruginea]MDA0641615.1 DUF695 domain-containing protein [Nonomuraea ferruginea]
MRLFGRKSEDEGADPGERVAGFWQWWASARPELDAAVAAGESGKPAELLGPAVAAVHPDLVWELAPGRNAAHALVVTAAGDAELRSLAHRWARAAPPADMLWEFHPSRQASALPGELTLDAGGIEFGLDKLVLGLRVPRGALRVDVTAHHPIFGELGEDARMDATLLALDRLLGEDDVARWVGEIVPAAAPPIDAVPAVHLPVVVADVAADYDTEQWAMLEGRTASGAPLVASARYPLRPVDYPLLDHHIAVTLPYRDKDAGGLPQGRSLAALGAFEERLGERLRALGDDVVLAANLSAERRRVMHVYATRESAAAAALKELASTWKEGRARVDVTPDPAWSAVAAFLA